MTYTPSQTLTFAEFLAHYGNDSRYELIDGELRDRYPTGRQAIVKFTKWLDQSSIVPD